MTNKKVSSHLKSFLTKDLGRRLWFWSSFFNEKNRQGTSTDLHNYHVFADSNCVKFIHIGFYGLQLL